MGIHHLATFLRRGQEEKNQCKLALPYLTIYLGLLTAFTVPLDLRPRSVDVAKSRIPTFLVGIDKSKLSDEEWVQLVAGLKKIPGIRIGCEVNRA